MSYQYRLLGNRLFVQQQNRASQSVRKQGVHVQAGAKKNSKREPEN